MTRSKLRATTSSPRARKTRTLLEMEMIHRAGVPRRAWASNERKLSMLTFQLVSAGTPLMNLASIVPMSFRVQHNHQDRYCEFPLCFIILSESFVAVIISPDCLPRRGFPLLHSFKVFSLRGVHLFKVATLMIPPHRRGAALEKRIVRQFCRIQMGGGTAPYRRGAELQKHIVRRF